MYAFPIGILYATMFHGIFQHLTDRQNALCLLGNFTHQPSVPTTSKRIISRQITTPMFYNNIRNMKPFPQPPCQQSAFIQHIDLYHIRFPSLFSQSPQITSHLMPIPPSPLVCINNPYICPLCTHGIGMFLDKQACHLIPRYGIPCTEEKNVHIRYLRLRKRL